MGLPLKGRLQRNRESVLSNSPLCPQFSSLAHGKKKPLEHSGKDREKGSPLDGEDRTPSTKEEFLLKGSKNDERGGQRNEERAGKKPILSS